MSRRKNTRSAATTSRVDDLRDRLRALETRATRLTAILSTVLVIIGGLGLWQYLLQRPYRRVEDKVIEALVDLYTIRTVDYLNQFTAITPPGEQAWRFDDLAKLEELLKSLDPQSQRFRHLTELVRISSLLMNPAKAEVARQDASALVNKTSGDVLCRSRALLLRATAQFVRDRKKNSQSILRDAQDALQLDGSLAPAFNLVGVETAQYAADIIEMPDSLGRAIKQIGMAEAYLECAIKLDPSAVGTHKPLNNIVWSRALLINAMLLQSISPDNIAVLLHYANIHDCLAGIRHDIARYEILKLDRWTGHETKAQALSVMAHALRVKGDPEEAQTLREIAANALIRAVPGIVDFEIRPKQQTPESIWDDPLLAEIGSNDQLRARVEKAIRDEL